MLLESIAPLMLQELVNILPKVVGFLRALRFSHKEVDRVVRKNTDREVKSQLL